MAVRHRIGVTLVVVATLGVVAMLNLSSLVVVCAGRLVVGVNLYSGFSGKKTKSEEH